MELLRTIAERIVIPEAVRQELLNPPPSLAVVAVDEFAFIETRKVIHSDQVAALLGELDPGEAEAIALAKELGITTLLIDEAAGRSKAMELGLDVVGTIGILLRAKQLGEIGLLEPMLDDLQDRLGFYLSVSFRQHALRLAGED